MLQGANLLVALSRSPMFGRPRAGYAGRVRAASGAMRVARLQGAYNVVGGLWPLLHMRSFEAVLGPKVDRWLVNTVAGLMVTIGVAQLSCTTDPATIRQARRLGMGAALTLGGVDVAYAPRRRISRMYLLDAAGEAGWLLAWAATWAQTRRECRGHRGAAGRR